MGWAEGLWVCWCREVGPWVPEKNVGSPIKLELQINIFLKIVYLYYCIENIVKGIQCLSEVQIQAGILF